MAKAKACRCKKEECEECPEWIFTFADLVMLMMGFFVILWVLKPAGNPKSGAAESEDFEVKAFAAIRGAFGYEPNPQSKDPVDMQMILDRLEQLKIPDGPGDGGKTKVKESTIGTDPEVTSIRVGRQSVVGSRMIFAQGDAKLSVPTLKMLDQIADQIRGHRNIVMVKGHTSLDDFGDNATAAQKMDLSLRRAQIIADYLTAHGVTPDILRVQGCSTFEPVVQHEYTAISKEQNRRVEVEVTPTLVDELQQQPTTAHSQAEQSAPAPTTQAAIPVD
jgi:flagellar motor protein MotB